MARRSWPQPRRARASRMGAQRRIRRRRESRHPRGCRTDWVAVLNTDVEAGARLPRDACARRAGRRLVRHRQDLRSREPRLLDGTFDMLCRGGTAWRAGTGSPTAPRSRAPRAISSPPWTAALFRAELFPRRPARRELRIVPGRRRFRVALRADGISRPLRAGGRGVAPGSATLGRWHPGNGAPHLAQPALLVARHYSAALLRLAGPGRHRCYGAAGAAARRGLARGCAASGRAAPSSARTQAVRLALRSSGVLEQLAAARTNSSFAIVHASTATGGCISCSRGGAK